MKKKVKVIKESKPIKNVKNNNISIDEFMATNYVDFSKYVLYSRAIPSIVDGLKISQRKILDGSSQIWKNGKSGDVKPMKVFQLAGFIASQLKYHHGNSSLESAIIAMAQDFKNNIPYLISDSQIGSRYVIESGSPRYVSAKLNTIARYIIKDTELLTYKYDEGFKIEPEYFLPIIPMLLINGSSGIAVGFACDILNRNPKQVIQECINHLNGKVVKKMKPSYTYFKGDFIQDEENDKRWFSKGIYQRLNTNTIQITEVPIGFTYETYDKLLQELQSKELILSYEDNSKEDFNYNVKVSKSWLANATDTQIIKLFKLEKPCSENFTLLDENGKLKIFNNAEDILKHFVDFRLTYYEKRKLNDISKTEAAINILNNKARFIKCIIDKELAVNNIKKEIIEKNLDKLKFDKVDGNYDYMLRMPIYSLTKETYDKLKNDISDTKLELTTLKKSIPREIYIKELEELKKVI